MRDAADPSVVREDRERGATRHAVHLRPAGVTGQMGRKQVAEGLTKAGDGIAHAGIILGIVGVVVAVVGAVVWIILLSSGFDLDEFRRELESGR